jgi:pimeloyl-ACP methyl ester carboxylesterase
MKSSWKGKPLWGFGIGIGFLGAVAIALRHRARPLPGPLPDEVSPAIFASRVTHTRHGQLLHHTSGSGTPLLFLHGIYAGASSYEWSKVYPRFVMSHQVLAADLLGFGESARLRQPADCDAHVETLHALIQEHPPSAVVVASGASCLLALLLAARHPDRVSRLILLMPTSVSLRRQAKALGLPGFGAPAPWSALAYRHKTSRPAAVRQRLARWGFSDPTRINGEHVSIMGSCAAQYGAQHAVVSFRSIQQGLRNAALRAVDVRCAVEILWPADAKEFPRDEAATLLRAMPQASIRDLPAVSILAALEDPALVEREIRHCLEGAPGLAALNA